MKKPPINLKKVKIDDHIKNSKKGNNQTPTGKRGRPRKNPDALLSTGFNYPGGGAPSSDTLSESDETSIRDSIQAVEPIYDTTEEAKGFLRAPFDIVAGLSGIPELALYPQQLDALAPSFKIVYDKRIAPKLGEDADLIAFAVVLSGVAFEKIGVWREVTGKAQKTAEAEKLKTNEPPFIPTEHHV
jgi:hypothetical protein